MKEFFTLIVNLLSGWVIMIPLLFFTSILDEYFGKNNKNGYDK